MSMGDGFAGMSLLPVGMFVDGLFLPLLTAAFFAFLSVTFFDLRFLMDIWTVQAQERRRLERQQQATATAAPSPNRTSAPTTPAEPLTQPPLAPTPIITAAGADTLPLPATASRPRINIPGGAIPILIPSDQDLDDDDDDTPGQTTTANTNNNNNTTTQRDTTTTDIRDLYTKFYFLLVALVFISLWAASWPPPLRSFYANALACLYLSFWVPQIHRNVIRNCRKALLWRFVIGQSVLRVLPFAYFYGVRGNVLFIDTDRRALAALLAWVWLQVWILVVQDLLGPRVFVKEGWAPPAYEYHPVLRDDVEGNNLPIGFTDPESPSTSAKSPSSTAYSSTAEQPKDRGKRVYDCAICMQTLEVPVLTGDSADSSLAATTKSTAAAAAGGKMTTTAAAAAAANSVLGGIMLARRAYMVTPCRHIFHTECLEGAMRYRLSCPVCREGLPPL
ncbi:hypothetical protein LTS18_008605 [Coniosporium uncinatum]|uniref:Uncharacterized protein n=1 Tax=Coniosporium uncinatum TaxID=93489 RepID=A0ACC3D1H3_9PEZI|nr:hypothetical protein LTS18_008605 [Coniosporium uncinatum]